MAARPEATRRDDRAARGSERSGARGAVDQIVPALPPERQPVSTVARPSERLPVPPEHATSFLGDPARSRRVYRLANPWYRQLLRGVIACGMIAVVGAGLFFGARLLQDLTSDDVLPEVGATPPAVQSSVFEVRSVAPGPLVDGTLTVDMATGAFEFLGRPSGSQPAAEAVSPDGESVFVRRSDGGWQLAASNDALAIDVRHAARFLIGTDSLDAVLTAPLRDGLLELRNRSDAGPADDRLTRYDVELDTQGFATEHPAEFEAFGQQIVPDTPVSQDLDVTVWVDERDLLVQMDVDAAGWAWQRIADSADPFEPDNPIDDLLTGSPGG